VLVDCTELSRLPVSERMLDICDSEAGRRTLTLAAPDGAIGRVAIVLGRVEDACQAGREGRGTSLVRHDGLGQRVVELGGEKGPR
jgi:hypothetical protein